VRYFLSVLRGWNDFQHGGFFEDCGFQYGDHIQYDRDNFEHGYDNFEHGHHEHDDIRWRWHNLGHVYGERIAIRNLYFDEFRRGNRDRNLSRPLCHYRRLHRHRRHMDFHNGKPSGLPGCGQWQLDDKERDNRQIRHAFERGR